MELRIAGASYADIVKANIGYKSAGHVSDDMRQIVNSYQYQSPEDLLVLDLARVDEMQKHLTLAFRRGEYGYYSALLRLMSFRREIMGVTQEAIQASIHEKSQIQNNGIMVVQGTAGDYLASMMHAAGATQAEIRAQEARSGQEVQGGQGSAQNGSTGRREITGEIVPADTGKSLPELTSGNAGIQNESEQEGPPRRARRLVLRKPRLTSGDVTSAPEGSSDLARVRQPSNSPKKETTPDQGIPEEEFLDRLEDHVRREDENQAAREHIPALPTDGPILAVDILPEGRKRVRVRIKHPDANEEPGPGVPYRAAPRKPRAKAKVRIEEEFTTSAYEEEV